MVRDAKQKLKHYVPVLYRNASVSTETFASNAVAEINTGVLKTGNHVCLPHVCFKGRGVGKFGFCRMHFWHWVQAQKKKGGLGALRVHGLQLRQRWNGVGDPPVCNAPPMSGLPALEMNHPFHFKLTPSMMLGPRCNHDLGILLRFPLRALSADSGSHLPESEAACEAALGSMIQGMVAREFYCSNYSTKEQPHIEGLLHTLLNGVRDIELEMATRQQMISKTKLFVNIC